jgi:hypothetical protein
VAERADRTRSSKIRDLNEFWNKQAVGFAGERMGGSKSLSKGEAQAMLQRLISAGSKVDFDEVRRLRKLIAVADNVPEVGKDAAVI